MLRIHGRRRLRRLGGGIVADGVVACGLVVGLDELRQAGHGFIPVGGFLRLSGQQPEIAGQPGGEFLGVGAGAGRRQVVDHRHHGRTARAGGQGVAQRPQRGIVRCVSRGILVDGADECIVGSGGGRIDIPAIGDGGVGDLAQALPGAEHAQRQVEFQEAWIFVEQRGVDLGDGADLLGPGAGAGCGLDCIGTDDVGVGQCCATGLQRLDQADGASQCGRGVRHCFEVDQRGAAGQADRQRSLSHAGLGRDGIGGSDVGRRSGLLHHDGAAERGIGNLGHFVVGPGIVIVVSCLSCRFLGFGVGCLGPFQLQRGAIRNVLADHSIVIYPSIDFGHQRGVGGSKLRRKVHSLGNPAMGRIGRIVEFDPRPRQELPGLVNRIEGIVGTNRCDNIPIVVIRPLFSWGDVRFPQQHSLIQVPEEGGAIRISFDRQQSGIREYVLLDGVSGMGTQERRVDRVEISRHAQDDHQFHHWLQLACILEPVTGRGQRRGGNDPRVFIDVHRVQIIELYAGAFKRAIGRLQQPPFFAEVRRGDGGLAGGVQCGRLHGFLNTGVEPGFGAIIGFRADWLGGQFPDDADGDAGVAHRGAIADQFGNPAVAVGARFAPPDLQVHLPHERHLVVRERSGLQHLPGDIDRVGALDVGAGPEIEPADVDIDARRPTVLDADVEARQLQRRLGFGVGVAGGGIVQCLDGGGGGAGLDAGILGDGVGGFGLRNLRAQSFQHRADVVVEFCLGQLDVALAGVGIGNRIFQEGFEQAGNDLRAVLRQRGCRGPLGHAVRVFGRVQAQRLGIQLFDKLAGVIAGGRSLVHQRLYRLDVGHAVPHLQRHGGDAAQIESRLPGRAAREHDDVQLRGAHQRRGQGVAVGGGLQRVQACLRGVDLGQAIGGGGRLRGRRAGGGRCRQRRVD
ncbi:hypothetical protein DUGA2_45340 [Duganella sp. HH101]|nr:hypothetical protein DUGA2_45340 [Duganella sp. HH101]